MGEIKRSLEVACTHWILTEEVKNKPNLKTCLECNNPVFGGGYCKYHQYKRRMAEEIYLNASHLSLSQLIQKSPKRKKDNRRYRERIKDRWNEAVKNKTNYCFICNGLMEQREDNHHIRDREVTILDEALWVFVHRMSFKVS